MTRDEARHAAEVMLAFADGKQIEAWDGETGWEECNDPYFSWGGRSNGYRIKPESKYRPFKRAEECWAEMQKHQPFGWMNVKGECSYRQIHALSDTNKFPVYVGSQGQFTYGQMFETYTFADGTPFGVLEK